jgi:plasmid stabilization system protein ParE
MIRYRFTPQASADLFELWRYIASDNPEAADRVESAVYDACAFIAEEPLCGQVRKDFTRLPPPLLDCSEISQQAIDITAQGVGLRMTGGRPRRRCRRSGRFPGECLPRCGMCLNAGSRRSPDVDRRT